MQTNSILHTQFMPYYAQYYLVVQKLSSEYFGFLSRGAANPRHAERVKI